MIRNTLLTVGALFALLGARSAIAGTIDQQSTFQDDTLSGSTLAGQSFTPTLSSIDFATFSLHLFAVGSSTLQVNLLSGDGYGGSLLGSTPTQTISNLGFQQIEFDFAAPVALTPGDVYTLQIDLISGTTVDEAVGDGNPYAGGQAYFSNGTAFSGSDLVFSEGVSQASTPEPTTLSMVGFAALAMVGLRRFVRR